jgi:hypothetical protein
VILVAVAIVIAIAVAFWASGLVGVFTRFEKIEIVAAYWDGSDVVLIARNTGSSIAVIDMIMANGAPCITGLAETVSIGSTFSTQFAACAAGAGGSIITGGVTNEIAREDRDTVSLLGRRQRCPYCEEHWVKHRRNRHDTGKRSTLHH